MIKESILAAAMTLTPWHGDVENPEEREARLETIAQAIEEAVLIATCSGEPGEGGDEGEAPNGKRSDCKPLWRGSPRRLAFLLLGQAYFETRLALHVHAGNCRAHIGECDSGRAISLWQLQAGYHLPKEHWETLSGTDLDSTRRAAVEAARALGRGRNFCGTLPGAIALYATGQSCRWEPAQRRAAFVRRLESKYYGPN